MEGKRLIDKEKVIKGLECCIRTYDFCPEECPYRKRICYGECGVMDDALKLLKTQEHIKPKVTKRKTGFGNVLSYWFNCGDCNKPIERLKYRFCPYCGKGIKWDEWDKSEKDD